MAVDKAADPETVVLVAGLADNKYFLGRRYAEWCTAAPTLESAVAAAAMAQDEIGHARSLYPLLQDLAGTNPETEPETRTAFTNVPFLDRAFTGWPDFIAANFIFDTGLTILLDAARESSMLDLAKRARRMLEEEPLHWLHAEGWTRRLAAQGEGVRAALAASLAIIGNQTLQWYDIVSPELVSAGLVSAGPDDLRWRFRDQVNPVLTAASLPNV